MHCVWPTVKGAGGFSNPTSFVVHFHNIASLSRLLLFVTVQIVYVLLKIHVDKTMWSNVLVGGYRSAWVFLLGCFVFRLRSKHWKRTHLLHYITPQSIIILSFFFLLLLITLREYMCSIAFIVYAYTHSNRSTGGKRKTFICLICCCCRCWQFLHFYECKNMFYYNSLLDGSIPMQQQQHQTNEKHTLTTRKCLDRCQFGWSYFPVWMYRSVACSCLCVCSFTFVFEMWMRDKRPRLLLFRLFDWLLTKKDTWN